MRVREMGWYYGPGSDPKWPILVLDDAALDGRVDPLEPNEALCDEAFANTIGSSPPRLDGRVDW